jgi:hypothetical protein
MSAAADIVRTVGVLLIIVLAAWGGFDAGVACGQLTAYEAIIGSMHDAVGLQVHKAL